MFCRYCGAKIDDNSEYCKYCGGNQNSDTFIDTPDSEGVCHTVTFAGEKDKSPNESIDPFDEKAPNNVDNNAEFNPFSDENVLAHDIDYKIEYTNPFDREIQASLGEVNSDAEVQESYNNSYIKQNRKKKEPRLKDEPIVEEVPELYDTNTNATCKHFNQRPLSIADKLLAIATAIVTVLCPILGVYMGRHYIDNMRAVDDKNKKYTNLVNLCLKISKYYMSIWFILLLLAILLPVILL